MVIHMKKPGIMNSRNKSIKQILEGKNPKQKAKAMVDYFSQGGSVTNILQLIEGKAVKVCSIRDLSDSIGIKLERAEIPYKNILTNVKQQQVVVVMPLNTENRVLQECVNKIGFPVKAKKGEKNWLLKVQYSGESVISESVCHSKDFEKIQEILVENNIQNTPNFIEHTVRNAKKMDSDRLSNEMGLPFNVCKAIRGALKLEDRERKIGCSNCYGLMESVGENTFRCVSCHHVEKYSKKQSRLALIAENKKPCEMCGEPTIKLVNGKSKLVESAACPNCGHVHIVENTTQADVGVGTASAMGSPTDKVMVGACPDCNGSMLDVGDSYRCLSCPTSKLKSEMDMGQTPQMESFEIRPANLTERNYKLSSGLPLIIEMADADMEIDQESEEYSQAELDMQEMGVHGVHISGRDATEAINHLKESGMLDGVSVMGMEAGSGGWTKCEDDDGIAYEQYLCSTDDMQAAQDLHHALTAQDFDAVVEMASDEESDIEYDGIESNMFASDEPSMMKGESTNFGGVFSGSQKKKKR